MAPIRQDSMQQAAGGNYELLATLISMKEQISSLHKMQEDLEGKVDLSLKLLPPLKETLVEINVKLAALANVEKQFTQDTKTLATHAKLISVIGGVCSLALPCLVTWLIWLHTQLAFLQTEVKVHQVRIEHMEKPHAERNTKTH